MGAQESKQPSDEGGWGNQHPGRGWPQALAEQSLLSGD